MKELRELIAASLFMKPCTEKELGKRDFLKNISYYGIGVALQTLDKLGATYYRGETIYVYKDWVKKNLQSYDLI